MTFQLVLTEASAENPKDIGENVFFDNLDTDYKVYLFYYPGTMADRALESRLRELGDITGKNLFVNIGRLNDKRHDQIVQRFDVKKYPVIIVAAEATLASSTDEYVSAFVRLDSEHLLASPERAVDVNPRIRSAPESKTRSSERRRVGRDCRRLHPTCAIRFIAQNGCNRRPPPRSRSRESELCCDPAPRPAKETRGR